MNNKPVAWVTQKALDDLRIPLISEITLRIAVKSKNTDPFNIPLYTHPHSEKSVKVKELTNDEMREVINEIVDGVTVSEMVTFLAISKAILRRAHDK